MSRKHFMDLTPRVFKQDFMEGLIQALSEGNPAEADKQTLDASKTPVDIILKQGKYTIRMDMPGVKLEDIDITVENGILIISGDKNAPLEEFKDEYQLRERSFGHFKRAFKLSDQIDVKSITADLTSGVLEVVLPKKTKELVSIKEVTLIC